MKIKIILPIALAIILPGLNFFSNSNTLMAESELGIYERWIYSSLVLYVQWYVLLYVSELRTPHRRLFTGLSILLSLVLIYLIFLFLIFKAPDQIRWIFIVKFLFASILFMLIQYALKAQQNISKLQLEKEQIQSENYKVQLDVLRSKIDPHFLFNSLNTLRSMVRHQHPQSEKFVLSLSDFYRQTLKYNENATLKLSDELTVLQSYLFLIKNRNENAVIISVEIDPALESFLIPTLGLQTVVENCFKHNSMTSKSPLHIQLISTEDFAIEVINNIQPKIDHKEISGYGLETLKKRYELMNIEQGVSIHKSDGQFRVKLKLI